MALALMVALSLTFLTDAIAFNPPETKDETLAEQERLFDKMLSALGELEQIVWDARKKLSEAHSIRKPGRSTTEFQRTVTENEIRMLEVMLWGSVEQRKLVTPLAWTNCPSDSSRRRLLEWEQKNWARELDSLGDTNQLDSILRVVERIGVNNVTEHEARRLAALIAHGKTLAERRSRYLDRHPLIRELEERERRLLQPELPENMLVWRSSLLDVYGKLVSELGWLKNGKREVSDEQRDLAEKFVREAKAKQSPVSVPAVVELIDKALESDPSNFPAYQLRRRMLESRVTPSPLPDTAAERQAAADKAGKLKQVTFLLDSLDRQEHVTHVARNKYIDAVRRLDQQPTSAAKMNRDRQELRLISESRLADSLFERVMKLERDPDTRVHLLERERDQWKRMIAAFGDASHLGELRSVADALQQGVSATERASDLDLKTLTRVFSPRWRQDWLAERRPAGMQESLAPISDVLTKWAKELIWVHHKLEKEAASRTVGKLVLNASEERSRELTSKAERMLQQRSFQEARDVLLEALDADPRNALVYRRFRRLVEILGRPTPAPRKGAAPKTRTAGSPELKQMLDEIVLPEIGYDGLTLKEVLADLEKLISAADRSNRKLRFSIEDPKSGLRRPSGLPDLGLEDTIIEIKLPLYNLSLRQLLNAVCRTADRPLTYELMDGEVVFREKRVGEQTLATRAYSVGKSPELFEKMLRRSVGLDADEQIDLDDLLSAYVKMAGLKPWAGKDEAGVVQIGLDWKNGWLTARGGRKELDAFSGAMATMEATHGEVLNLRQSPLPGRSQIVGKLNSIVIPEIAYDGLTLDEVVQDLSEQVRRHDPEKRGLNFLIVSSTDSDEPKSPLDAVRNAIRTPVLDAMGNPISVPPPLVGGPPGMAPDLNQVLINIKLPLFNLKLAHVLDAIVKTADQPIRFVVTDYAVVFEPGKASATQPLFSRIFKLDAEAVRGMQIDTKTKPRDPASMNQALREILEQAGVDRLSSTNTAQRSHLFYNPANGYLMFRGTLQDADIVQQLVDLLTPKEKP